MDRLRKVGCSDFEVQINTITYPYVCPFGRESGNTHTDDVKSITPDTSQTWGVIIVINVLIKYKGN